MAEIRWHVTRRGDGALPADGDVFALTIFNAKYVAPAAAGRYVPATDSRTVVSWKTVYDEVLARFSELPARAAPGDRLDVFVSIPAKHMDAVMRALKKYTKRPEWPLMSLVLRSETQAALPAATRRTLTRWMYPPTPHPISVRDVGMLDEGLSVVLAAAYPRNLTARHIPVQTPMATYFAEHKLDGVRVRYSRLVVNCTATTYADGMVPNYKDVRRIWLGDTVLAPDQALQTRLHEEVANCVYDRQPMSAVSIRSVGSEVPGASVMPTAWTVHDEYVVVLTYLGGYEPATDRLNVRRTLAMYGGFNAQFVWACHNETPLKYLPEILREVLDETPRFIRTSSVHPSVETINRATQFRGPRGTTPETVLDWAAYFQWTVDAVRAPELRAGPPPHWQPAYARSAALRRTEAFARERLSRYILYDDILYQANGELHKIPLAVAADFHNVLAGASMERLRNLVARAGLVTYRNDIPAFLKRKQLLWTMQERMSLWAAYVGKTYNVPPRYEDVNIFPLFNQFYTDMGQDPTASLPEFETFGTRGVVFTKYSHLELPELEDATNRTLRDVTPITVTSKHGETTDAVKFSSSHKIRMPGRVTWIVSAVQGVPDLTQDTPGAVLNPKQCLFYVHATQLTHGGALTAFSTHNNPVLVMMLVDKILSNQAMD